MSSCEKCSLCRREVYEEYNIAKTACWHVFHLDCLLNHMNKCEEDCPVCMKNIVTGSSPEPVIKVINGILCKINRITGEIYDDDHVSSIGKWNFVKDELLEWRLKEANEDQKMWGFYRFETDEDEEDEDED